PSIQAVLEPLVDATHRCRASIRTLNGPLLGPVHFGVRSKPRSVTVVMNLGLLGLPSKSRSHGPAFKTQSPEQGDGCRYLPNLLDSLPSLTSRCEAYLRCSVVTRHLAWSGDSVVV